MAKIFSAESDVFVRIDAGYLGGLFLLSWMRQTRFRIRYRGQCLPVGYDQEKLVVSHDVVLRVNAIVFLNGEHVNCFSDKCVKMGEF